jgi:hypothetical protein
MTDPADASGPADPGGPASGPPVEFGTPPAPPDSNRWRPDLPTSRDVFGAVVVGVALVIAGAPLGLLWAATSPKVNVAAALAGSEAAFDAQAGIDVHFAFLALLFGVVTGLLVGWRGRHASWPLAAAIAVGGVAGSILGAQIGHLKASDEVLRQLPPTVSQHGREVLDFTLRAHGFYFVLPAVALLLYFLIVLLTTRREPPRLPETPDPSQYWSVPR